MRGKTARGRTYVRVPLSERFWLHVEKDGPVPSHMPHLGPCWIWSGASLNSGYGCVRNDERRTITAHLAAWLLAGKDPPANGLELCHACDVRLCVNHAHVFVGTHSDNMRDAAAKGRNSSQLRPERLPRGSAHHQSKLTEDGVREILSAALGGASFKSLSRKHGVSDTMIGLIVKRKFWKHVEVVS